MKRTLIERITGDVPQAITPLLANARLFDSSCSPEARVYFIDGDEGYYLKSAAAGTLAREAEMTAYFHTLGLATDVLH